MKNIKLYIRQIKRIIIVDILVIVGCEDNIQKWELQVNTFPNESGLVVRNFNDTHIDTLDISQYYEDGTELLIEAHPIIGWTFDHWRGDIEHSSNPTILIKDNHKSITAVFSKLQYAISTTIIGKGEILEDTIAGKTTNYDYGTNIKLTAIPETGWTFERWNGDLSGSENPTTIILGDNKSIVAVFKSNVFGIDSTFTIVATGQSNMVGVGTGGGDLFIDSRVKVWNDSVYDWILADPSRSLATETLFINYHANNNSLAFHFAKQIAEVYDVEVKLLLLAKSGINIDQYITIGNESTYYDTLRNSITASEINEVDCILWHQGEANNYGDATSYAHSLQIVIDRLRSEPEIKLTTPFIAGELIEGTSRDTRNDVYFNLDWFIDDNYVAVAKLHDLPGIDGDEVHFSGNSLVIAGRERYYEALQSIVSD